MKGRWSLLAKLLAVTVVALGCYMWTANEIGGLVGPGGQLTGSYPMTAEFTDATGVASGDSVQLAGVPIGRVTGISVKNGLAVVTMAIDRGQRLPAGTDFALHWKNLLGQRYVLAEPPAGSGPHGRAMVAGAVVGPGRTTDAADLNMLLNSATPLLDNLDVPQLNEFSQTLAAALQGRQNQLGQLIGNTSQLVTTLSGQATVIGSSIQNLATVVSGFSHAGSQLDGLLSALSSTSALLANPSTGLANAIGQTSQLTTVLSQVVAANSGSLTTVLAQADQVLGAVVADRATVAKGLAELPWATAGVIRATNVGGGQWFNVYAKGVGIVNTDLPAPQIGPNTNTGGADSTASPSPLLGTPRVPVPPVPSTGIGPVTVNPTPGSYAHSGSSPVLNLKSLLAPLLGGSSGSGS